MRKMLGGKTTQSRMGLVSSFKKKERKKKKKMVLVPCTQTHSDPQQVYNFGFHEKP